MKNKIFNGINCRRISKCKNVYIRHDDGLVYYKTHRTQMKVKT